MITIGVCGPVSPALDRTFALLGVALGASFERRTFGESHGLDGWVVLGGDRRIVSDLAGVSLPCYVVVDAADRVACGSSAKIEFASAPALPSVLRGLSINAEDARAAGGLPPWLKAMTVLASKDGLPMWAARGQRQCCHHYVALEPPALQDGEPLFRHFSGTRVAALLPLVVFIRTLTEDDTWEAPPLQAAFMFDDPNLHWTSYGFIDYREMIARASAGEYHVAMATIPIDTWYSNPSAVALFKEHPHRISLLYHGNDHVSNELARSRSGDATRRMLGQALGRIANMEARTGLDVSRVMAAPHGACNETAFQEMGRLGFEAACVSRGSLHHHNQGSEWTQTIGMKVCEFVNGLPVIPRFALTSHCYNDVLIAALLRQPIVAVTHHQGVANGYGLLNDVAAFVNGLGSVAWSDLRTITRSLYWRKRDQRTLNVRMASNYVHVEVEEGIAELRIEQQTPTAAHEPLFWRRSNGNGNWSLLPQNRGLPVIPGATFEVASGIMSALRPGTPGSGSRRLVPVARRLLTELRDRSLPSIQRLSIGRATQTAAVIGIHRAASL